MAHLLKPSRAQEIINGKSGNLRNPVNIVMKRDLSMNKINWDEEIELVWIVLEKERVLNAKLIENNKKRYRVKIFFSPIENDYDYIIFSKEGFTDGCRDPKTAPLFIRNKPKDEKKPFNFIDEVKNYIERENKKFMETVMRTYLFSFDYLHDNSKFSENKKKSISTTLREEADRLDPPEIEDESNIFKIQVNGDKFNIIHPDGDIYKYNLQDTIEHLEYYLRYGQRLSDEICHRYDFTLTALSSDEWSQEYIAKKLREEADKFDPLGELKISKIMDPNNFDGTLENSVSGKKVYTVEVSKEEVRVKLPGGPDVYLATDGNDIKSSAQSVLTQLAKMVIDDVDDMGNKADAIKSTNENKTIYTVEVSKDEITLILPTQDEISFQQVDPGMDKAMLHFINELTASIREKLSGFDVKKDEDEIDWTKPIEVNAKDNDYEDQWEDATLFYTDLNDEYYHKAIAWFDPINEELETTWVDKNGYIDDEKVVRNKVAT